LNVDEVWGRFPLGAFSLLEAFSPFLQVVLGFLLS
jgi:hypothetical protein